METNFLWRLSRQFEQGIVSGKYADGEILSSKGLASQFQVSTDQAIKVLSVAHRKGLVAKQRAATFQVLGLASPSLPSVFTHTASSGLKPTSKVRAARVEPATLAVAEKLNLEAGAPVYLFERTRYVNEEALANQVNYIPAEICPGLELDDLSQHSFQKLLEQKYFTILTVIKEDFEIVPASEQDLQVLDLPTGSSVLLVQRLALSATGCPVVWANIRIRPDRFEYVAALWPEAASLLTPKHPED